MEGGGGDGWGHCLGDRTAPGQDLVLPPTLPSTTHPLLNRLPTCRWAYLPYSMHMAGPREAIQHMIIRKVGRGGGAVLCCALVRLPLMSQSVSGCL